MHATPIWFEDSTSDQQKKICLLILSQESLLKKKEINALCTGELFKLGLLHHKPRAEYNCLLASWTLTNNNVHFIVYPSHKISHSKWMDVIPVHAAESHFRNTWSAREDYDWQWCSLHQCMMSFKIFWRWMESHTVTHTQLHITLPQMG